MAQQWFYTKDGKTKIGPVSSTALKTLATSGHLKPTDMILKEGMGKWLRAEKVKGLFDAKTASMPIASPASPNLIQFSCPRCKSLLDAPDDQAGEKINCPKCSQRLQIPGISPAISRDKTVLGAALSPVPPTPPIVVIETAPLVQEIPEPVQLELVQPKLELVQPQYYYLARDRTQDRLYSTDDLKQLARKGRLKFDEKLLSEGSNIWQQVSDIPWLAARVISSETKCTDCTHCRPRYICGHNSSEHYQLTVDPTHSCHLFEPSLAQGYFSLACVKCVVGEITPEMEVELWKTAIQLGLREDDEVTARLFLAGCLRKAGGKVDSELFSRALEQVEHAANLDCKGGYELLDKPLTRLGLQEYDAGYAYRAITIKENDGTEAAISYLETKLSVFSYTRDPMVLMIKHLADLYLDHSREVSARPILQRILEAQPFPDFPGYTEAQQILDDTKDYARRRLTSLQNADREDHKANAEEFPGLALEYAANATSGWTPVREEDGEVFYATEYQHVVGAQKWLDKAFALELDDPELKTLLEDRQRLVNQNLRRSFVGNWGIPTIIAIITFLVMVFSKTTPPKGIAAFWFVLAILYVISSFTPQYRINKVLLQGKKFNQFAFLGPLMAAFGQKPGRDAWVNIVLPLLGLWIASIVVMIILPFAVAINFYNNWIGDKLRRTET